jgi:hypothetical protein
MKIKLSACAAIAAFIVAPTAALANVETFSEAIPTSTVPFTFDFTLPAFDTSLGTLTGVTLTIDNTTVADIEVINLNGTPQPFTGAFATIPLTLTGPDGLNVTSTVTAGPISGVATQSFPSINQFPGNSGSSSASVALPNSEFAFFENPPAGTDLSFSAASLSGTFGGSGGQGVLFGGTADVGGTAQVTYTFAALVPEPATWAMMLIGFGGMGGVLRSARRRTPAV